MQPNDPPPVNEPKKKWYYDIWFVIVMLVTIGPFAFPFLWKSTKFSLSVKWSLTIIFVLITVFALWGTAEMVKYTLKHIQDIQSALY